MIIDWGGEFFKTHNKLIPPKTGGCCVYTQANQPANIDVSLYSVRIHSDMLLEMISFGLRANAWRTNGIGQCDAILFPASDNKEDALLLIETKYSESDNSWQNYKDSALKQITDTVSQLYSRHCPVHERNLFGLISCPLLDSMGASAFAPDELIDIYRQYKLNVHMGNSARFLDAQNISFAE